MARLQKQYNKLQPNFEMRKIKNTFFAIAIGGTIMVACNNNNNKSVGSEKMDERLSNVHTVSPFTSPVNGHLQIYLKIKNVLVTDNDMKAANVGYELVKALDNFDKDILRKEEKMPFDSLAEEAKKHSQNIAMNLGNIKDQREYFDALSRDMYDMMKRFTVGERVYVNCCPMYNNNKGALWLSETMEIKNPYSGNVTLTCGKVTETIQ